MRIVLTAGAALSALALGPIALCADAPAATSKTASPASPAPAGPAASGTAPAQTPAGPAASAPAATGAAKLPANATPTGAAAAPKGSAPGGAPAVSGAAASAPSTAAGTAGGAKPAPSAPPGTQPAAGAQKPATSTAAPTQAPPPAPAAPAAAKPAAGPAPTVVAGVLNDSVYAMRFPVPRGWSLKPGASSDEMVFAIISCDDCLLRILVTPGDKGSLDDTVRVLRAHIEDDPESHIIGEEPITIAKEGAYTLVKEETISVPAPAADPKGAGTPPPAAGSVRMKTRYVALLHGGRKFYLMLKAPSKRFPTDDKAFEELLSKFQFVS